MNEGRLPIYEPGLGEIVDQNVEAGRLHFSTDVAGAIPGAEVVFLAVGTPPLPDGSADMSYIFDAVKTFSRSKSKDFQVLVTKSTVPVGTGTKIEEILSRDHAADTYSVASNPEFLREGCAVADFMNPDRIIIGCNESTGLDVMLKLYKPMRENNAPILMTNRATAELIKYASNAFLATKISFINEVSRLCEEVGADVQAVAKGMGMDPRIGPKFLNPGPGYGGSCFPKDTRALLDTARSNQVPLKVVKAAVEANEDQIERAVRKIQGVLGELAGKTVALLGLAFKGDTDDVRESPALRIAQGLVQAGAKVRAYDPQAAENALKELPELQICSDPYEAAQGAEGLVVATEWNEFKKLDWPALMQALGRPSVIDLRNLYDPSEVKEAGLSYVCLGRP